MARMIPAFIDDDAPPGERDVFNMLAGAPDDWVILHSLDLAPWSQSRRTEVDFVLIIPNAGILCIEVKSHDRIEFADGAWLPKTMRKSPFKQAMDARFALQRGLRALADYAWSIPFGCCCVFPNASFPLPPNLSVSPRDLMDVDVFRNFQNAPDFAADLRRRLLEGVDLEKQPRLREPLAPLRIDNLVALCLPVRRRRPDAADETRRRQREIESVLRAQQKPVLELAALNPRLLVTGGAGTGKTLVAMELALRFAEQGKRVALVCFNRLVGRWMRTQVEARNGGPNVVVDSASRLLMRLADVVAPSSPDERFWAETVPLTVLERLSDPTFAYDANVDVLIVDEAQDILGRPDMWNCLLALLRGGAEQGCFVLFGDVEHQVLSGRGALGETLQELFECTSIVRWHMGENCRNPRTVAEAALALAGLPPDTYSGYLRTGGSATDVTILPCEGEQEASARVRSAVSEARGRGFRERDISLLSFAADEHSTARALLAQGMRLMPADTADGEIAYSSVQAFKGMESPVVIVTDTRVDLGELGRNLFYTALTRATGQAYVLCRRQDAVTLGTWVSGGAE